jgi:hypothetical protein
VCYRNAPPPHAAAFESENTVEKQDKDAEKGMEEEIGVVDKNPAAFESENTVEKQDNANAVE